MPTPARPAAHNAALQSAAELLGKVLTFALLAVVTRELGRNGYGQFSFAVSLTLLLTGLAELGTDEIVARDAARNVGGVSDVVDGALAIKAVSVGVAFLVTAVVALTGGYSTAERVALLALGLSGGVDVMATSFYAAFQGLGDLAPSAKVLTVQRLLRSGLGIAAMVASGGIAALAGAYLFASVVAFIGIARRLHATAGRALRPSLAHVRRLGGASAPIAISMFFQMGLLNLNVVILSAVRGDASVGLYGAASRVVDNTYFLPAAVLAASVPALSRADWASGRSGTLDQAFARACRWLLVVLGPLSAVFAIYAHPIARAAFGAHLAAADVDLRLLAPTVALSGTSLLAAYVLIVRDRQRLLPFAAAAATALNLTLTALLVPGSADHGAAAAMLASETLYVLVLGWAVARTATSLPFGRIVLGPLVGTLAMVAVAIGLGPGLLGLLPVLFVYPLAFFIVERIQDRRGIAVVPWFSSRG